jgi:hypothetical protein
MPGVFQTDALEAVKVGIEERKAAGIGVRDTHSVQPEFVLGPRRASPGAEEAGKAVPETADVDAIRRGREILVFDE